MSEKEATVVSACSGGRYDSDYEHCRFVRPEDWRAVTSGLPRFCGAPALYAATSKAHRRDMLFLVCGPHAADTRLMDWLESLRTYHPPGVAADGVTAV